IQFRRPMKIALRIWCPHFDLSLLIRVTFRNPNRSGGFENEIIFLFNLIGHEPVSDAARNDNVIFGAITLLAEHRLDRTAASDDKDDLIRAAVLVIWVLPV